MFRPAKHGSTVSREILAGITTFAAMSYILVVNPGMLAITGMDHDALISSTALAAAAGTLLMAFLTNYPIALAPGMGLNAFFTFTICGQLDVPWQGALAMVFWTGILFIVLSLTRFREEVVRAIPDSLKTGIQTGIGFFIIVIGLKGLGFISDPAPSFIALRLEPITTLQLIPSGLALLGCVLALILMRQKVAGALLIAIGIVAFIGLFIQVEGKPVTAHPEAILSAPPSVAPVFLQVDWFYPFKHWESVWMAMITLFFVDLFDSVGTLIGVSRRAKLTQEDGTLPRMAQALGADAGATTLGACFGTSTTTAFIESATGVEAGGKTGLTGVIVAACFLLALFFHPLISVIPPAAVAPALLIVGGLMIQGFTGLKEAGWQAKIGAIAIAILIPLNFQIAEGIAAGCVIYTLLMYLSKRGRELHWFLTVLSLLFLAKFLFETFSH